MCIFTLYQVSRHELDIIQMAVAIEHLHETEFMRGSLRPTENPQYLAHLERIVTGGTFYPAALPHHQFTRTEAVRSLHKSTVVHALVILVTVWVVFAGTFIHHAPELSCVNCHTCSQPMEASVPFSRMSIGMPQGSSSR